MCDCVDIRMLPFDEGATYSHIVGQVNVRSAWVDRYLKKGENLGILIEYSIPMLKAYERYHKFDSVAADDYAMRMINFPTGG